MTKPGYRMTEIGEIPEEWDILPLTKLATYINGMAFKPSDWKKEGIPIVRIENLNDPYAQFNYFGDEVDNRFLLSDGDILLSWSASLGVYIWNRKKAVLNQHIFKVVPNKTVDKQFIYWALHNSVENLKKVTHGSTMKHFQKRELEKTKIALPPLSEQQKIAEILSSMDEAIQRVNDQITKTERLKKGLMQTLLTKGIGHTNFKMTEIGEIPKNWNVKSLDIMIEILDLKRVPLSETERANKKGTIPYCGANGIIDYIDDYIFDEEAVLIAEDGGNYGKFQNKAYIMIGKYWVNNHAHIFRGRSELLENKFIMQWLNFSDISPYVSGSTRTKLNQEMLKRILVPTPSLQEQQKIAEILSDIDSYLGGLGNYKAKLNSLKKGLMQDLLTGKVRVNNLEGVLNINGNTV